MNTNKLAKVYEFSASWCQPCKVFKQTFDKVKEMEEYKDIEFKQFEIEDDDDETSADLVEKFKIQSVPTTILLDENDDLIYKLMGNVPLKDLTDVINKAIGIE